MDYYNSYNYMNSTVDSIFAGIVAIYLIILAVLALFYVISYVFKGIGMFTIAKRQGKEYPWLAFIPFARTYLHGELAGNIRLKNKSIKNPGIWLLVMPFIFGALNFIFYIIFCAVGFSALSSVTFGSIYGHHMTGLSTGAIMGMIVVFLLWMATAVIYGAAFKVLKALVNHQIVGGFTTSNMSVAHAVLCLIVPLYESICLFVMRNRPYQPGKEPDLGRPFMQAPPPVVPPQGGPAPGMSAPYGAPVGAPQGGPVPHEEPAVAPQEAQVPHEEPAAPPQEAPAPHEGPAVPPQEAQVPHEGATVPSKEDAPVVLHGELDQVEQDQKNTDSETKDQSGSEPQNEPQGSQTYGEYVKQNEDSNQD
ncbi:RNA-binding protein [Faecalicatena sp. AGMB00832]|uniref:RNA-binding protein n=1 Tax=Faecalicatena faecalis TaxID=2726362 RepID=A0ABS6D4Y6_9FIRM|nr:RNA-binding protein [Faecalicatena faecalis]MBU3876541.1 RNA-binding protein [Faecalicatena faecalis]